MGGQIGLDRPEVFFSDRPETSRLDRDLEIQTARSGPARSVKNNFFWLNFFKIFFFFYWQSWAKIIFNKPQAENFLRREEGSTKNKCVNLNSKKEKKILFKSSIKCKNFLYMKILILKEIRKFIIKEMWINEIHLLLTEI